MSGEKFLHRRRDLHDMGLGCEMTRIQELDSARSSEQNSHLFDLLGHWIAHRRSRVPKDFNICDDIPRPL
jgi:hypothetical protein